jgi:DoxX-like family
MLEQETSKGRIWTGRILSGLTIAFFCFDGVMKLIKPAPVVAATVKLGYPESTIVGIGCVLLISTALYAIPRTAAFGALLLTAYLGGAVATNVRAQQPLFNLMFPVIFAVILWVGLALRHRHIARLALFEPPV